MTKLVWCIALVTILFTACKNEASSAAASVDIDKSLTLDKDSESDKFSYGMGMVLGNQLKQQGIDSINYNVVNNALNASLEDQDAYAAASRMAQSLASQELTPEDLNNPLMLRGIYDVLEGDTTLMNMMEQTQAQNSFLEAHQLKVAERNLQDGLAFLQSNKEVEGVVVSETGLQFQLLEEGSGPAITKNDIVNVDYTGTTIDGEMFDTSVGTGQPYTVDISGDPMMSPIPGFMEGLSLFPIGSKYKIFIPSNLAYQDQRRSELIGPNSVLIFELENLSKVEGEEAKQFRAQQAAYIKQMQQQQQQYR